MCLYVYMFSGFCACPCLCVTLRYKTQKKRRTQIEYADKRNTEMQNTMRIRSFGLRANQHVRRTTAPCICGVFVVVWWCFCTGVFVVVFLWWCVCGGVLVLIFFWWCSRAGLFVVVFLWWCGRVCVVVFLCRCVCGGVVVLFVVVRWCFCVGVVVFLRWCLCSGACVTNHKKNTQSFWQFSRKKLPKRSFRARLPQLFKEQASKRIVSCEASSKFHRTSFQNERFARCFRQFLQKKLPKGSFRARLPPNFIEEASKTSVSRDASTKIHRTSFQNERSARCFRQFSQKKLPKWSFRARLPPNFTEEASKTSVSRDASSKIHRTSFQNERSARCFRQFSPKICVSLQFRAIDTPIPARGFIGQKQNVPRTTTPCIPKFQNARFATAACAKMYESINREPTRFAHTKM